MVFSTDLSDSMESVSKVLSHFPNFFGKRSFSERIHLRRARNHIMRSLDHLNHAQAELNSASDIAEVPRRHILDIIHISKRRSE